MKGTQNGIELVPLKMKKSEIEVIEEEPEDEEGAEGGHEQLVSYWKGFPNQ